MNQDEIKKLGLQLEDSPQVCLTLQEQEFPSHEKPRADVCMRVSAYAGYARGCTHVSVHVCSGTAAWLSVGALPTSVHLTQQGWGLVFWACLLQQREGC